MLSSGFRVGKASNKPFVQRLYSSYRRSSTLKSDYIEGDIALSAIPPFTILTGNAKRAIVRSFDIETKSRFSRSHFALATKLPVDGETSVTIALLASKLES